MTAPEDEEFVYRARQASQPVDPAVRRMALAAGGVSAAVIVVALLWSGVRATGFGPPPVILAPPGPIRVVPASPGGLTVPEADQQIMSGETSSAPAQLAPEAEGAAISQLDQAAGVPVAVAPAVAAPALVLTPVAPASGPLEVQLAATVDEKGAASAWSVMKRKMPELLDGKKPVFVPAVVNGQSIWRVRLGGFASEDDARAFCVAVKAKDGACTVAAF